MAVNTEDNIATKDLEKFSKREPIALTVTLMKTKEELAPAMGSPCDNTNFKISNFNNNNHKTNKKIKLH